MSETSSMNDKNLIKALVKLNVMTQLQLSSLANLVASGTPVSSHSLKEEYDRQFRDQGAEYFAAMMARVQRDLKILDENQWEEWERQLREPPDVSE